MRKISFKSKKDFDLPLQIPEISKFKNSSLLDIGLKSKIRQLKLAVNKNNNKKHPSISNNLKIEDQRSIKGMIRSHSVKEKINLKDTSAYHHHISGLITARNKGSSNYFKTKKSLVNEKKMRNLENLEKAIQKHFPSVYKRRRHNLSIEQSHPTILHNMSKERYQPIKAEVEERNILTRCLTERNCHNKSLK